MTTKTLHYNEIVEKVYGLTLDEKEELKNLLEHNIAEEKRVEIAENYRISRKEEKEGKLSFSDDINILKELL